MPVKNNVAPVFRGSKSARGGPYPLAELDPGPNLDWGVQIRGGGGVQIRCDTGSLLSDVILFHIEE